VVRFSSVPSRRRPRAALFSTLLAATLLAPAAPVAAAEAPLAPWRPFLERVLSDHPRAALAERGLEQARAEADSLAQPLYNPELGSSGEYTRSPSGNDSSGGNTLKTVVEVSLTTDFGVKQESRRLIGERGIDVARAASAGERLKLAGEALAGLARFQGARRQESLAARQEQAMQSFLILAERLHRAGDSSAADLALARLALADIARLHADALIELVQAREALRGLCACTPDDLPGLPDPLAPDRLIGGTEAGLDDLPEVQTSRARVETARADLRLARDERVPDPTFRLGGGQDGGGTVVTFGVSLPIPVLNSGAARVTTAGRTLATAEAAEQAARRAAQTEIATSRAAATEAWRGWRSWQEQAGQPVEQHMLLLEKLWVGRELSATDYFVQMRETIRAAQQGAELWTRAWTTLADGLHAANRIDSVVGL